MREALKNVLVKRSRLFGLLLIATAIGVSAPTFAAFESMTLTRQLSSEQDQGRNVIVISALSKDKPVLISRQSCETLTMNSDVDRAGFLISAGDQDLFQIGAQIPVIAASTTLIPQLQNAAAVVGEALGSSIDDQRLRMPDGTVLTATRSAKQPDTIGSNSAVVVALQPDLTEANTCTVVLNPLAKESQVAPRLVAELRSTGGSLMIQYPFSEPRDPIAQFLNRPERFLPLLLSIIGALCAVMVNRLRTGEWAALRMSGTSARSVVLLQLFEQLVIAGCMVSVAAGTAAIMSSWLISPGATLSYVFAGAGGWVALAILLSLDLTIRKPTDLGKER
jgi:hypothetical protein